MSKECCLIALVVAMGCKKKEETPTARFSCQCGFLTDMDEPSSIRVDVCVERADLAVSSAVGCAQTGAPATISDCDCAPSPGTCPESGCTVHEYK